MSDQQQDPTPAPEAAPEATAPEVDDFDPARAMDKIRKANSEARAQRDRAKAAEDAKAAAEDKVKVAEQAAQRVPDLEAKLLRAEVALELGLPAALAKRLLGATREELLADAEELMSTVAKPRAASSTRPVESLKPGSGASDEPSIDSQIAAAQRAGDIALALRLTTSKLAGIPAK